MTEQQKIDKAAIGRPVEKEPDFEVLEDNWQALEVFMACQTQWNYAGMSGMPSGINYQSLQTVMQMMGITDTKKTFEKVQAIESGALSAMQKAQQQAQK